MEMKKFLLVLSLLIVYLVMGGVIFHFLESEQEEQVHDDFLNFTSSLLATRPCLSQEDVDRFARIVVMAYDNGIIVTSNSSRNTNWDLASSIFFSITVVTTIGYGHLAPSTVTGRVFFVAYTLAGIPLALMVLAIFGSKISSKADSVTEHLSWCSKHPRTKRLTKTSLAIGAGLLFLMVIPSVVFCLIEGWSFGTAMYYCFVSLSTVGFGDYIPGVTSGFGNGRAAYRISVAVWLFVGLAWMSSLISLIKDIWNEFASLAEDNSTKVKPSSLIYNSSKPRPIYNQQPRDCVNSRKNTCLTSHSQFCSVHNNSWLEQGAGSFNQTDS